MLDCDFHDVKIFPFRETYEKQFCSSWVATAIVGGSAISALATGYAANKASAAQTNASQKAQDTAMHMYDTTRGDLAPFRAIGTDAGNRLGARLDDLTAPIVMDQDALEKTPGYQFTRTQGLKAVGNSAAARGLGVSGAALKGAATFATGLADNTYKTQFDIENTNRTNAFNRLKALIDTGQNAAAQTGAAGTKAADTVAGAQIGAGNAQAAGINATGGAVSKVSDNIAGFAMYKGLFGGPGSGATMQPSPNGPNTYAPTFGP